MTPSPDPASTRPATVAWPASPPTTPEPHVPDSPAPSHFVQAVRNRAGLPDVASAAETAQATLRALGAALPPVVASDCAPHLPDHLAESLVAGATQPRRCRDLLDLYQEASAREPAPLSLQAASERTAAVLSVLGDALPPAQRDTLLAHLPPDIARLVP